MSHNRNPIQGIDLILQGISQLGGFVEQQVAENIDKLTPEQKASVDKDIAEMNRQLSKLKDIK